MMGEREGQVSQKLQLYPVFAVGSILSPSACFLPPQLGGVVLYPRASLGPDPEVLSASK